MNGFPTNVPNINDSATLLAAYGFVGIVVFTVIFLCLLDIVIKWKIIGKIDGKGWKSLIPIYNDYTIWKNVWSTPMFFVNFILTFFAVSATGFLSANSATLNNGAGITAQMLVLVGIVAIAAAIIFVLNIIYLFKLSQAFGHSSFFVIGLFLLPTIFEMILAFSNDKFVGKKSKNK